MHGERAPSQMSFALGIGVLATAGGIAVAVVSAARLSRIEALIGFDPYALVLVVSLSVLSVGAYIVWPSRWNVPAHLNLGFAVSAYVIPIALTDTLSRFPQTTMRDYARLVGVGALAFTIGLLFARRRWLEHPPALLTRALTPASVSDAIIVRRTATVVGVAVAGLACSFAVMGFVPLFAADPLSAKLFRGEYQQGYLVVAPLYRFSTNVAAELLPLLLVGWVVTRRAKLLGLALAAVGLLLGALNRSPALTGPLTFLGIVAALRRSTAALYVATVAIAYALVGATFFVLLGQVGLSNFTGVYGAQANTTLNLWQVVAAGTPDVADQLSFMLAYDQYGVLTLGRTFFGGLLPYHYAWNPAVWSLHVVFPNVDINEAGSGGLRLPAPVWGYTAFGWVGAMLVPLLSGVLLGAVSAVARAHVGRGSLVRSAYVLVAYTSVGLPLSAFYDFGYGAIPPMLALLYIGSRWRRGAWRQERRNEAREMGWT
jgi:hypothetical protein